MFGWSWFGFLFSVLNNTQVLQYNPSCAKPHTKSVGGARASSAPPGSANGTKVAHWKLLEQLFKSMCKNGLKLSPKKCQLFRTKLTYIGNEFVINKRTMTITPLRSRTEAISKIPTPKTAKQCKSFCGVVNYLSLFCPDLQTLLKPIVELTRKGRPFVWGQEQEKAFKEVKLQLTKPPVLHLTKAEGRFILYSDTSVEGTGISLWQMQEGKAKLIGYASKTLPEAFQGTVSLN